MSGGEDQRDPDRHRPRDDQAQQPRQAGGHQRAPQLAQPHGLKL